MMSLRTVRTLRRLVRYRAQLLVAASWLGLLVLAQITARTPQLLAGSLMVWAVLGLVHRLAAVRESARELERETASEIALAVLVPRTVTEEERRRMEQLKSRIALAIRGRGAHLREVSHG